MDLNNIEDITENLIPEITHFGKSYNHIQLEEHLIQDHASARFRIRFFTLTNQYTISIRFPTLADTDHKQGYMGCTATSRTPRAGETHTRGSDLADGPLNYDTWHQILADIVSYEMVRLAAKPSDKSNVEHQDQ